MRSVPDGHGRRIQGVVAFSTTDTSVEIPCHGLKFIEAISLTPLASAAANDVLGIDETATADSGSASSGIVVPAAGSLTLTRVGAGTSGLKVSYVMWGW